VGGDKERPLTSWCAVLLWVLTRVNVRIIQCCVRVRQCNLTPPDRTELLQCAGFVEIRWWGRGSVKSAPVYNLSVTTVHHIAPTAVGTALYNWHSRLMCWSPSLTKFYCGNRKSAYMQISLYMSVYSRYNILLVEVGTIPGNSSTPSSSSTDSSSDSSWAYSGSSMGIGNLLLSVKLLRIYEQNHSRQLVFLFTISIFQKLWCQKRTVIVC